MTNRPNVILITIDTLRADHLGVYGYGRNSSPIIDALAREGAHFRLAIAQFSQTNPSHASILTGTYAATHKVKIHGVDKVDPGVETLAQALSRHGYTTAGFHSWPSLDPAMSGFDRGFASYRGIFQLAVGHEFQPDVWRRYSARADRTTDVVLDWLRNKPAAPYFLWVHYLDPHYPYTSPPPYDTLFDPDCRNCVDGSFDTIDRIGAGERLPDRDIAHLVALYDGAIAFTDFQIGRLIEALKELDMLDTTAVIVTGDHGESFGENGRWFHPFVLYNTVVHVPLVIRYPRSVPPGTVVDSLAQSVDIAPTVLDLAGLPVSAQIEGRSLVPAITGKQIATDRFAITQAPNDATIALTTREWKLIRDNSKDEQELYDLRADPRELRNLAASNPTRVEQLETQLKAWMAQHGIRPKR